MGKRHRRTDKQLFLDKLAELTANNVNQSISGNTLRDALGWEDKKNTQVKTQLANAEEISISRGGPGGSISLNQKTKKKALTVFISYSHKDQEHREKLNTHLVILERIGLISNWSDAEIKAGDKWEEKIWEKMGQADICLFLVSADFISSKFCYEKEMVEALRRGNLRVIPVIVRACVWKHSPLQIYKALPDDGKAITSWANQDEAMASVADGVRKAAEEMQEASGD
jgi:hypothetical protein